MTENTELLEQLRKLLSYKKSKAFYAEKLGISVEEVDELMAELRGKPLRVNDLEDKLEDKLEELVAELDECVREINEEKGTLKSSIVSNFEPKSHEELAQLHKVDLTKYKISSYWTKQRGDKFTSSLLCILLKPSEFDSEKFTDFLKNYKSDFIPNKQVRTDVLKEAMDVEISLADFHIDKLDLNGETIYQRKKQYTDVLVNLIEKVSLAYHINKVIFTIGNDFFQTDTYNNTTTKGTPVDCSETWYNAYEEGFKLLVWAISYLYENSKHLEVILVSGNHDRTKSYYLAHALEAYFGNTEGLTFNRSESPLKYTVLGQTFIGYHHGDCKIDDLPLIFATDRYTAKHFGNATYREIRTGDKHYYLTKEIKGVRIQQLPSLSGTDRWHRDNQFVNNLRAGLALVYDELKGKVAEFEERI